MGPPMLAPWTLLSGILWNGQWSAVVLVNQMFYLGFAAIDSYCCWRLNLSRVAFWGNINIFIYIISRHDNDACCLGLSPWKPGTFYHTWSIPWVLVIRLLAPSMAAIGLVCQCPLLLTWVLTLIPAWISKHMPSKMPVEITFPFLNFNGATMEVWGWISSFISNIIMDIFFSMLGLKLIHVSKRSHLDIPNADPERLVTPQLTEVKM